MSADNIDFRVVVDTEKMTNAVNGFRLAVAKFITVFEDRDKWHAQVEGQWPDKFTVLNRFVRTGVRPPYIFND